MSDHIDEISRKKRVDAYKAYYEYLADIEAYEEEVDSLDVEDLILQVCAKDREIQFGRKIAHLNSRALLQESHQGISNQRASIFREKTGLYLDTAGVVCQVVSIGAGGIFGVIGTACSQTTKYVDNSAGSRRETLNYSYDRTRDIIGDHSQQKQSAEKNEDQDGNAIDRMIQNSRRQGELVAG